MNEADEYGADDEKSLGTKAGIWGIAGDNWAVALSVPHQINQQRHATDDNTCKRPKEPTEIEAAVCQMQRQHAEHWKGDRSHNKEEAANKDDRSEGGREGG